MKKILLACFIVCSILFGGAFLLSLNGVERFTGFFIEDRYKTLFLSKIKDFNNYFYLVQIFLATTSLLSGAAVFYIDQIFAFLTIVLRFKPLFIILITLQKSRKSYASMQ
jgi:hypothetical protein